MNLKRSEFILFEWHGDHTLKPPSPVSDELKNTPIIAMINLYFYRVVHRLPMSGNSEAAGSLNCSFLSFCSSIYIQNLSYLNLSFVASSDFIEMFKLEGRGTVH